MARFSRRSVLIGAIVLVLILAGAGVVYGSERVRCVIGLYCAPAQVVGVIEQPIATSTNAFATTTATSTASTTISAPDAGTGSAEASPALPRPTPAPIYIPPYVAPVVTAPPVVVPVTAEEGPTTFAVSAIPLLSGGDVRAGQSVPISYLMVANRGSYAARLTGFTVRQNGNAPTRTVIGLSTVDDKGGSREQTGGFEGSSPFSNGIAFAPTSSLIQPGQFRLFTIKAIMSSDISASYGMQLKIDVTSLQAEDVTFTGSFPIRGTTWTLVP